MGTVASTTTHGCRERNGGSSVAFHSRIASRAQPMRPAARSTPRADRQRCREAPRRRLVGEQPVDPRGIDPRLLERQHRARKRRRPGRSRALVGAELGEQPVAFVQTPQPRDQKQRAGQDPPSGETQRIAAPEVVALMCEHRLECGRIQCRDRRRRDVDARAQQTGAEGVRVGVVDHDRAVRQRMAGAGREPTRQPPLDHELPGGRGERSDAHREPDRRQPQHDDRAEVRRRIAQRLTEEADRVAMAARIDSPGLDQAGDEKQGRQQPEAADHQVDAGQARRRGGGGGWGRRGFAC